MPQPRPALQRLSAPASLHNGDRESEFEGFKGGKWLKINLTRQLKHGLAFSCLWQLVQVYFRRFWGDLSAERGSRQGFGRRFSAEFRPAPALGWRWSATAPSSVCHLLALQRPASGLQLDLQLSSPAAPVALSASWVCAQRQCSERVAAAEQTKRQVLPLLTLVGIDEYAGQGRSRRRRA